VDRGLWIVSAQEGQQRLFDIGEAIRPQVGVAGTVRTRPRQLFIVVVLVEERREVRVGLGVALNLALWFALIV
jgi:hypothetical protein